MTYVRVANNVLAPLESVNRITVEVTTDRQLHVNSWVGSDKSLRVYRLSGIPAIELIMQVKPSLLEGTRMRYFRHMWAFHNLVGHPVMQLLAFVGLHKQAVAFHDWTAPKPKALAQASDSNRVPMHWKIVSVLSGILGYALGKLLSPFLGE